jgi:pimeloyl-ACP methyl ester carboxylesterase
MINNQMIDFNGISVATKSCGLGKDAIIFIHGSCMNSDTWLPQLKNQELNSKYRLIAFDLPGNGQSGWYTNDTKGYRPKNIALLVKTIIEKFNVERYLLVGLSYGTNIIGEIDPPLPNCAGILLEGVCIVNDAFPASAIITPGPNGHVIVAANPADEELHDYTFLNVKSKEVGERFIKSYRAADPAFREEMAKTMMESDMGDELENIKNWKLPVCIMFGKEEKLIKTDYLNEFEPLWNRKVYHIENASHVVNEEAPEEFNKTLLSFAAEVFK